MGSNPCKPEKQKFAKNSKFNKILPCFNVQANFRPNFLEIFFINSSIMARGQQKIQSQQKAAEKAAKLKKAQGNSKKDNEKTAAAGLKSSCSVCKAQMPDPKTYKQHFENKHSKLPMPEELKEI